MRRYIYYTITLSPALKGAEKLLLYLISKCENKNNVIMVAPKQITIDLLTSYANYRRWVKILQEYNLIQQLDTHTFKINWSNIKQLAMNYQKKKEKELLIAYQINKDIDEKIEYDFYYDDEDEDDEEP